MHIQEHLWLSPRGENIGAVTFITTARHLLKKQAVRLMHAQSFGHKINESYLVARPIARIKGNESTEPFSRISHKKESKADKSNDAP
jgi:hypothetical protein